MKKTVFLFFLLNVLILAKTSFCFTEETPQQKSLLLEDPEISTFVHAIDAAGLSHIFTGTGPFTAFIPTNKAFEKFGNEKLKSLLKSENQDQLTSLLINHIVYGKYPSKNLKPMTLKTLHGKNLTIRLENGEIRIDEAKVVKVDVEGPNGIIHEIDTVLVP